MERSKNRPGGTNDWIFIGKLPPYKMVHHEIQGGEVFGERKDGRRKSKQSLHEREKKPWLLRWGVFRRRASVLSRIGKRGEGGIANTGITQTDQKFPEGLGRGKGILMRKMVKKANRKNKGNPDQTRGKTFWPVGSQGGTQKLFGDRLKSERRAQKRRPLKEEALLCRRLRMEERSWHKKQSGWAEKIGGNVAEKNPHQRLGGVLLGRWQRGEKF